MKATITKDSLKDFLDSVEWQNLSGSDAQNKYALDILKGSLRDSIVTAIATYGRTIEVNVDIDDRLIGALKMHKDSAKIIDNKSQYDFSDKKLVKIVD